MSLGECRHAWARLDDRDDPTQECWIARGFTHECEKCGAHAVIENDQADRLSVSVFQAGRTLEVN